MNAARSALRVARLPVFPAMTGLSGFQAKPCRAWPAGFRLALSCALAGLGRRPAGFAVFLYGKGLIGLRRALKRLVGLARFRLGLPWPCLGRVRLALPALPALGLTSGLGLACLPCVRLALGLGASGLGASGGRNAESPCPPERARQGLERQRARLAYLEQFADSKPTEN